MMYIRLYIKIIRNFGSSDRIVGFFGSDRTGSDPRNPTIRSDLCTSLGKCNKNTSARNLPIINKAEADWFIHIALTLILNAKLRNPKIQTSQSIRKCRLCVIVALLKCHCRWWRFRRKIISSRVWVHLSVRQPCWTPSRMNTDGWDQVAVRFYRETVCNWCGPAGWQIFLLRSKLFWADSIYGRTSHRQLLCR